MLKTLLMMVISAGAASPAFAQEIESAMLWEEIALHAPPTQRLNDDQTRIVWTKYLRPIVESQPVEEQGSLLQGAYFNRFESHAGQLQFEVALRVIEQHEQKLKFALAKSTSDVEKKKIRHDLKWIEDVMHTIGEHRVVSGSRSSNSLK